MKGHRGFFAVFENFENRERERAGVCVREISISSVFLATGTL
jgi:hypothetical protein